MEDLKRGGADYLYRVLFIYSRTTVVPEWIDGREVRIFLFLFLFATSSREESTNST
jgi:hypothetical protein